MKEILSKGRVYMVKVWADKLKGEKREQFRRLDFVEPFH